MNPLYYQLARRWLASRRPRRAGHAAGPLKLTVASTFLCNHRCKICSIWKICREHPEKAKEELTANDFARLFTELRDSLLFLDWGGGEPFMRPDLVPILDHAADTCPRLASVVITTNGLLTERIAQAVEELTARRPRLQVSVGVSLDGDAAQHDDIRGLPGAFQAATQTIARLRELQARRPNLEVKLSYTLCALNAGRFAGFHDRVLRPLGLQVGDVGFNLEHSGNLFQTDFAGQHAVGAVAGADFREAVGRDIAYILAQTRQERLPAITRVKSFYRMFFLEHIPGFLARPTKMVIPCMAAQNSYYLDPYGNVFPCIVWDRSLGNCRDGFAKIIQAPATDAARQVIRREQCPICWNACEVIPSLLTSWRLGACVARALMAQ